MGKAVNGIAAKVGIGLTVVTLAAGGSFAVVQNMAEFRIKDREHDEKLIECKQVAQDLRTLLDSRFDRFDDRLDEIAGNQRAILARINQ